MKHKPELLNALVDGELRGVRRWLVERHLTRCAACATEYKQLQRMRALLVANPVRPTMDESAEFFWSKVRRDIEAEPGPQREAIPEPRLGFADWLGQRRYAFAGAAAALVAVVAVLLSVTLYPSGDVTEERATALGAAHTGIPAAEVTAFHADEDVTVIWVSGLPWTENMNEMQTLYASLDT